MAPKTRSKKQIKRKSPVTKLSGKASAKPGKAVSKPSKKPVEPTRAMVLVHGVGKFPRSDPEKVAAKIKHLYAKPLETFVAYYADWDEQLSSLSIQAELPGALEFKQAFRAELQKQYNALPPMARPVVAAGIWDADNVGGLEVLGHLTREITAYFFKPNATAIMQKPLIQALQQARRFDEIYLVSHSLGTVVAFDVLKQMANQFPVVQWITLGCPLGKLRRVGMRDAGLGKITEATVENWYNVFDTTDIVADAISPAFPLPGYRIHDIFVEVASAMPGAHDYFNNAESLRLIVESIS